MYKQKAQSRFWHWFATEKGRRFAFGSACFTTVGLFAGNFLPHTFGLQKYKEFVQCYEYGIEKQLPDKVLKRVETAFDKLDVPEFDRNLIKPFTVFGFDLFYAGSTKYRHGAMLGIPTNYAYAAPHDINRQDILVRQKPIDWNSEHGRMLQEAIILSEDEQIFGICKTILQLRTHYVLLNSMFPSVSFFLIYSLAGYFNLRLGLFSRPLGLRLVLYTLLGFFGLGNYVFMKDFTQVSYDADIDKALSELGPETVDAGRRFYDKQLKKNMALRALLGEDLYTAKGNENYLLRQKSLPITARKSFFEERWKELCAGEQNVNEDQELLQ